MFDSKGRNAVELLSTLRGVGQGGNKSEALDSLAGLLSSMANPTSTCLASLPVVLPLITSSSASIRSSVRALMSKVFVLVDTDAMHPYITMITLWVTSGMSNIFQEVRQDAANLADNFVECLGPALVQGWQLEAEQNDHNGQRLFTALLTSLGVSHERSASSSSSGSSSKLNIQSDLSLSPLSKLLLLKCLDKLIRYQDRHAHCDEASFDKAQTTDEPFPFWIFRHCLDSTAEWEEFTAKFSSHDDGRNLNRRNNSSTASPFACRVALQEQSSPSFVDAEAAVLQEADLAMALRKAPQWSSLHLERSSESMISNPYLTLYASLHPLLLHTFLDHAPSVFGPITSSSMDIPMGLNLILAIFSIASGLLRSAMRFNNERSVPVAPSRIGLQDRTALAELSVLLDRAAPYFPFESRTFSSKAEQDHSSRALRRLSGTWCELVGAQQMLLQDSGSQPNRPNGKRSSVNHVGAVKDYMLELLQVDSDTQVAAITSAKRLSESEYVSLLPTLWHLMYRQTIENDNQSQLLGAFVAHWSASRSYGHIKTNGLRLILAVCSLPHYPSLQPPLRKQLTRRSSATRRILAPCLSTHLGRALYEIGSRTQPAYGATIAESALLLVLDCLRFGSSLLDAEEAICMLSTLTPFLWVQHPQRGGMAGPFKRLHRVRPELQDIMTALLISVRADFDVGHPKVAAFLQAATQAGL